MNKLGGGGGYQVTLSVGIIGARRRSQGTGPWMARAFKAAGCEVKAIVGTSSESLAEASAFLREKFQLHVSGYLSIREMLAAHKLDVVVVASPSQFHQENIEEVLDSSTIPPHILCEKPLFWNPGKTPEEQLLSVAAYESILQRFSAAGKHFALNTQWPWTLGGFCRLYPEFTRDELTELQMRLSPSRQGPIMVVDSASHLLSLLENLMGYGEIQNMNLNLCRENGWRRVTVECEYVVSDHRCAVKFHLEMCPEPPRPAWYSLNGLRVDRSIEQPGYRQFLTAQDGQKTELVDPLDARVQAFVSDVQSGQTVNVSDLLSHQQNFLKLVSLAHESDR